LALPTGNIAEKQPCLPRSLHELVGQPGLAWPGLPRAHHQNRRTPGDNHSDYDESRKPSHPSPGRLVHMVRGGSASLGLLAPRAPKSCLGPRCWFASQQSRRLPHPPPSPTGQRPKPIPSKELRQARCREPRVLDAFPLLSYHRRSRAVKGRGPSADGSVRPPSGGHPVPKGGRPLGRLGVPSNVEGLKALPAPP